METLKDDLPVWRDVFTKASTEKKKMMLCTLLEVVYISKDKISVEIKAGIKELLGHLYRERKDTKSSLI